MAGGLSAVTALWKLPGDNQASMCMNGGHFGVVRPWQIEPRARTSDSAWRIGN
jgi:hypothetical protein